MELLTGKAKEKFSNWLSTEMYYLGKEPLSDLFLGALIIEWFDSVGFYILIGRNNLIKKFYYNIDKLHYGTNPSETRQEATIAGIKKANEIFNSKF